MMLNIAREFFILNYKFIIIFYVCYVRTIEANIAQNMSYKKGKT
jgi:hypothetical protein